MPIQRATYVYVRAGGPPAACALQETQGDVTSYLEQHVAALQAKAKNETSPPANFMNAAARKRMSDLLIDDDEQFLNTAGVLANDLQSRLHGATKAGLFVALKGALNQADLAAILKLEVTEDYGGVLQQVAEGQLTLAAVRNVLDRPGDLQKGAVVPDPRPSSDVIVGDRLPDTSLYFLATIGATQVQKPAYAAVELAKVIQQVAPEQALTVVEHLSTTNATSPQTFLAAETDLSVASRNQILDLLTQRTRPITLISPDRAHGLKQRLTADGITITGRVGDIRQKVRWEPTAIGWRITIDVNEEPRQDWL